MRFIYNLGILTYILAARLLSPFSEKARLWVDGRKNWQEGLKDKISPDDKNIWIHCASLGEFEQGRPIIEALKRRVPEWKILLTFFSPSGYEIRKNFQGADYVCYLPADTPGNAKTFISMVNPVLAIFVKYEFWNNFLLQTNEKKIPLYLVSGIFRPQQYFFKWYGSFFRNILLRFTHIFVQNKLSHDLLSGIGIRNISLTGDTRFDRVAEIAKSAGEIPQLDLFRNGEKLFLAGSSWKQDEEIIAGYINKNPERMKWVFAPHEIDKENIDRIEKLLHTSVVRFSQLAGKNLAEARVLIIDNIGMLSSSYRYAYLASIGGGFGRGIHNILEAACWGIPVMFGPNYKNFREAVELINQNGAKCFKTSEEFAMILDNWLSDEGFYLKSAETAASYVKHNVGATAEIMEKIIPEDINNGGS
jgi:3-deoxy-D-manno-octulosonic-acid transferase